MASTGSSNKIDEDPRIKALIELDQLFFQLIAPACVRLIKDKTDGTTYQDYSARAFVLAEMVNEQVMEPIKALTMDAEPGTNAATIFRLMRMGLQQACIEVMARLLKGIPGAPLVPGAHFNPRG